jgi:hypothetical protein
MIDPKELARMAADVRNMGAENLYELADSLLSGEEHGKGADYWQRAFVDAMERLSVCTSMEVQGFELVAAHLAVMATAANLVLTTQREGGAQ